MAENTNTDEAKICNDKYQSEHERCAQKSLSQTDVRAKKQRLAAAFEELTNHFARNPREGQKNVFPTSQSLHFTTPSSCTSRLEGPACSSKTNKRKTNVGSRKPPCVLPTLQDDSGVLSVFEVRS